MGRALLKCKGCKGYFATGITLSTGTDLSRNLKFNGMPFRCTRCGKEFEYASRDLIDEGDRVGTVSNRARRESTQRGEP